MRACRPRRRPFLPRREGRTTRRAAPGETQLPAAPRRHGGERKQAGDPSFLIAGQERRVAVPKRPSGGERRQCGRQKLVSHSEIGFSSRQETFGGRQPTFREHYKKTAGVPDIRPLLPCARRCGSRDSLHGLRTRDASQPRRRQTEAHRALPPRREAVPSGNVTGVWEKIIQKIYA